jgi:hypothetical protein
VTHTNESPGFPGRFIPSTSSVIPRHRNTVPNLLLLQHFNSCKRVGPRQEQADNNVDLRDRLNVWTCFVGEQGFRAACREPANARLPAGRRAGMMARETIPPQSRIHECNRSRLPELKQKRQQEEKCRIKCREAAASQNPAGKG